LTRRLYLDSAPVVYAVERIIPYADIVDSVLADPDVTRVTSDLTRMECRVRPMREDRLDVLQDFDDFFAEVVHEIVSLSSEVIDHAARIRARYGYTMPDAIHLAAAVISECDAILTRDHRMAGYPGITIDVIGRGQ